MGRALTVRWTIGDVSDNGFEALRLSVWSAARLFGAHARYVVCVNTIDMEQAQARAGELPQQVEWRDVTAELWPEIARHVDRGMAEGVAWKFAPLRIDEARHELALDNDCILWRMPTAVARWLDADDACLVAEDVRPCFGQFAPLCGDAPRNSGIRGVPAWFDLAGAIRRTLAAHPVTLSSELDEQGLQIAALSSAAPPLVVSAHDVTICSPFPPHQPGLGACGAHFVGLNARQLPWELDGRPAVEHIGAHWRRHRPAPYQRAGVELPASG